MYYGRREDTLNRCVELEGKQLLKVKNVTVKSLQQESVPSPKSKQIFSFLPNTHKMTLMGYRNHIYLIKKGTPIKDIDAYFEYGGKYG
jgi:hypothetical protein